MKTLCLLLIALCCNLSAGYEDDVVRCLEGSWCSEQKARLIMEFVTKVKPRISVEIGACSGNSCLPLAAALKKVKKGHLFAVDAWSNEEAIKYLPKDDPNALWWGEVDMEEIKGRCEQMLKEWSLEKYVTLIHAPSNEAVHRFNAIDFLHLDGNFSEEGSLEDLENYLPKVKRGGYILLSNLYISIGGDMPKMPTLWSLYDDCELVAEVDNYNTLLFRKN